MNRTMKWLAVAAAVTLGIGLSIGTGVVTANADTTPTDTPTTAAGTYTIVAWAMPTAPVNLTTPTWPQTVFTHTASATEDLGALDSQLTKCGTQYQVDVYNENDTTGHLIAGGKLTGPNNPAESFPADKGWGVTYKLISNPACDPTPAVEVTPTVQPCTTYGSVVSSDLSAWNTSDTRATGHYAVSVAGLRIWTEGATSTDKVSAYYPTNFALANAGTGTVGADLAWAPTVGTIPPGLQQVVDFNNDGTPDGILIGEAVYGGTDWWLNNSGTLPGGVVLPANMTTGGSGSARHGTLNQWLALYPNTHVKAIGFSLGSGVLGDGIISRITLGCVNYTFAPASVVVTPPVTVTPQAPTAVHTGDVSPMAPWFPVMAFLLLGSILAVAAARQRTE